MPKIEVVGQTVQPWDHKQMTDGQTDRRYQVHYLPRFTVDKNNLAFLATLSRVYILDSNFPMIRPIIMAIHTKIDGYTSYSQNYLLYLFRGGELLHSLPGMSGTGAVCDALIMGVHDHISRSVCRGPDGRSNQNTGYAGPRWHFVSPVFWRIISSRNLFYLPIKGGNE